MTISGRDDEEMRRRLRLAAGMPACLCLAVAGTAARGRELLRQLSKPRPWAGGVSGTAA
jgi:hypothetical protein